MHTHSTPNPGTELPTLGFVAVFDWIVAFEKNPLRSPHRSQHVWIRGFPGGSRGRLVLYIIDYDLCQINKSHTL